MTFHDMSRGARSAAPASIRGLVRPETSSSACGGGGVGGRFRVQRGGGANAAIRNVRRVQRGGGRSPAKARRAERPTPAPPAEREGSATERGVLH